MIFKLLKLFDPFAIYEKLKADQSSKQDTKRLDTSKNKLYLLDHLFNEIQDNGIAIGNSWKKKELIFHKRYHSSEEKNFYNF